MNFTLATAAAAADWAYRGEGAVNLVLHYTGSSHFFVGKVLRVPKVQEEEVEGGASSALTEHERVVWRDVDGMAEAASKEVAGRMFAMNVMRPLLGPEHVDVGMHILVSREFLLSIENKVSSQRPSWRVDAAKLDIQCDRALLIADHSVFPRATSRDGFSIAVEIKPKCGFLPSTNLIGKDNAVKKNVSRYRMHQVLKLHKGEISKMSEYDPLDLFSGSRDRIKQAIQALFATPQNNLRVFLNGSIIFGSLGGIDKCESAAEQCERNTIFEECTKDVIEATHGLRLTSFQEIITDAIFKSKILDQLLEAQKLDKIDIEGAIHAYYNVISESCLVCESANLHEHSDKKSSLHCLPLDESVKIVRQYLTAATAKDCSLIISFRPTGHSDGTTKHYTVFLESTNQTFEYKASFIDLDLKPMKNMPYYYELDKKIVQLYSEFEKVERGT